MAKDGAPKRQARLGRGLSTLMAGGQQGSKQPVQVEQTSSTPPSDPETDSESNREGHDQSGFRQVPVDAIQPNPYQPRQQFNAASLASLVSSIKADGVLQPLLVRRHAGADDRFELVAGERRWRAAQQAGLATVPAIVRDLSDRETAELALIENLQREDLNPIERAEAFTQLADRYKLSHEQIAERVGADRSTISNTLRLLSLHDDVQQLVRDGLLSAGQARAIAALTDPAGQRALAIKAVKQGMSVRQVEAAVRQATGVTGGQGGSDNPKGRRAAHLADLEKQISQQLGTKVRISQGRKKGSGTLALDFYSLEQFETLLEQLGVKTD